MTSWAAAGRAKPISNRYDAKPDISLREPAIRSDWHRDEQTLHRRSMSLAQHGPLMGHTVYTNALIILLPESLYAGGLDRQLG